MSWCWHMEYSSAGIRFTVWSPRFTVIHCHGSKIEYCCSDSLVQNFVSELGFCFKKEMEELAWEKAVEAARAGQEPNLTTSLNLDGALKPAQSRLLPCALLEQFSSLQRLSVANLGLTSLADFPRLPCLEKLALSYNRVVGGLEHLVQAGLKSLRDLDLSNNKIQSFDDLVPLGRLNLISLDLHECPVTLLPDYRSSVFGLIRSLQYLDKVDAMGNERLEESDKEEEDDDNNDNQEDEEEDVDNGAGLSRVYVDKVGFGCEEEYEEDEEYGTVGQEGLKINGHLVAGRKGNVLNSGGVEEDEDEDEEEENAHIQSDGDGDYETEQAISALVGGEGELDVEDEYGGDGNAQGVENDEDEEGEDEEEEDYDTEYLVQPINKVEEDGEGSDFERGKDEDTDDDFEEDDEEGASGKQKRCRDSDDDERPPKRR
eukprot:Gb_37213 [translate_table: standard]